MNIEKPDFLLTIAIPTYNRRDLLKRALESIIPQLNSKIELLVSDNASDDGTDEMIAQSFPIVRYIKNETNKGWDYNFLQCYREATGKYVILFGSDDRMSAGAIDYLIDFFENNNCDLVFLNYRFFDVTRKEVYLKDSERIKNYQNKQDIVTTDRSLFMEYASHGITFISASVVRKSIILEVKNPEKFVGTNFIHTYIMLEALKGESAIFGVIMKPLIEANVTGPEASMTPEKEVTIFGKCMYSVLCVHAVECGFQERQMKKVYLQYRHNYPFWRLLILCRSRGNYKAIETFWKDGYPISKHFPNEWIKVMIVALTPRCVTNTLYKFYKALKKSE